MHAIRKPEPSTRVETAPLSQPPPERQTQETVFIPVTGSEEELAQAAYLATLADKTRDLRVEQDRGSATLVSILEELARGRADHARHESLAAVNNREPLVLDRLKELV